MTDSNPQATRSTRPRTHPSPITLRSPLHEPFPLTNDARTIRTGRAVWSNVTRRTGGPQDLFGLRAALPPYLSGLILEHRPQMQAHPRPVRPPAPGQSLQFFGRRRRIEAVSHRDRPSQPRPVDDAETVADYLKSLCRHFFTPSIPLKASSSSSRAAGSSAHNHSSRSAVARS